MKWLLLIALLLLSACVEPFNKRTFSDYVSPPFTLDFERWGLNRKREMNYSGEDATCVKGGTADSSDGSLDVGLEMVDRPDILPLLRLCTSPGVYRLRVTAGTDQRDLPNASIFWDYRRVFFYAFAEWKFEPGRRYEVRARDTGHAVHFYVVDTTSGPGVQLFEYPGEELPSPVVR